MIVLISIIVALYCLLILAFIVGFNKLQSFEMIPNATHQSSFSIIIPFRNEAQVLPLLLDSISHLEYPAPRYEIIFVDDDSDDDSVTIIEQSLDAQKAIRASARPDIRLMRSIRKTNSPKKDAINTAIATAQHDWIITTDADCVLPKTWLQAFDSFIAQKQSKLIVAPVTYQANSSFLEQFQLLDFLSLQGSTMGGFGIKKPFLCNGANLCYLKSAFVGVNGFEGNMHIASGDDIFLLEKMSKKYPNEIHYLKARSAIVTTKPQPTVKQLFAQRVRWAAKATAYQSRFSKIVSTAVFLMNFLLIVLLFGTMLKMTPWQMIVITFSLKFMLDFSLFLSTASFFNQSSVLKHFVVSSFIYPFFICAVALFSLKAGFVWKGRTFKQ